MHALIDEFAASRLLRVRAPLLLVAKAAAVSVTPADEHQITKQPLREQLTGLADRWVVAVIEADAYEPATLLGRFDQGIDFAQRPAGRLLDEQVLSGRQAVVRDLRERVVGCGDNDDVDIGTIDGAPPI